MTAHVLPVQPDAATVMFAGYAARLAADPLNVPALTGASFGRWYFFQYAQATQLLNTLLSVSPDDVYGNLFRGSSGVLGGSAVHGVPDLDRAIELAPQSPDVRFIVADAYSRSAGSRRAFAEATPRLPAVSTRRGCMALGSAWHAFGNQAFGMAHRASYRAGDRRARVGADVGAARRSRFRWCRQVYDPRAGHRRRNGVDFD